MSQRASLREFQQALSLRIQASTTQSTVASRLAIQVGDQNWLVDLADISEVIAPPPWVRVPLTQPWFLGLTNIRGRLYTVADLPAYAHLGNTRTHANNRLLLTHARFATNAALLVDQALGLRNIDQMQAEPAATTFPWEISSYRDQEHRLWHSIDIGKLLSDPGFLAVGAH